MTLWKSTFKKVRFGRATREQYCLMSILTIFWNFVFFCFPIFLRRKSSRAHMSADVLLFDMDFHFQSLENPLSILFEPKIVSFMAGYQPQSILSLSDQRVSIPEICPCRIQLKQSLTNSTCGFHVLHVYDLWHLGFSLSLFIFFTFLLIYFYCQGYRAC